VEGTAWPYSVFRILWTIQYFDFGSINLRLILREYDLPPLPYPWMEFFSTLPPFLWVVLSVGYLLCVPCVAVGWHTRFFQGVLAFLSPLLFVRSASLYQNHYAFFLFIAFYLSLVSTERYYSFDARRMRRRLSLKEFRRWQEEPVSLLPLRLILLQAAFLYFFAGLTKLDSLWLARWSSSPEAIVLSEGHPLGFFWQWLIASNLAFPFLIALACFMLLLSFGIFLGSRYPLILLFAAVMHMGFDLSFSIMEFTWMFLSILFLALFPSLPGGKGDRLFRSFVPFRSLAIPTQGHASRIPHRR